MNDTIYRAEGPYPEVVIPYKNPAEAKKLMNDYGGRDSETTAILSYSYQSYVLKETYPEIADNLEGISISEMLHHELLGTTISRLGGFPIIGGRNSFWNGSYVNYATEVKRILEMDIRAEQIAIENYEKTILILKNDSIKALLERIILDEEVHIKLLTEMLEGLNQKADK